jgi:phosphatidylinositol kinase/protein kinase (PI-3  family)
MSEIQLSIRPAITQSKLSAKSLRSFSLLVLQILILEFEEQFLRLSMNDLIAILAKAENIRTLFFALNDEVFAIREVAIAIIGRLTHVNPAYVIPSLRKVLIQMLTELEFSDVARNKEESAKLLSLLVQNSQRLIKPYVDPNDCCLASEG